MTLHPEDEVVVTMNEADWNRLRAILQGAYSNPRSKRRAHAAWRLTNRLCSSAEVLTLDWLDRKLEQFP